jgi:hypothetical protein
MMGKKLLVLFLITACVILGLVLVPFSSPLRYIINDVGQFLVILVAVIIGLERARFFTFKSAMGKALVFISLAALVWGFGSLTLLYQHLVLGIEGSPYPLLSDILFLSTIPLAAYGFYMLLKNISTKFDLKITIKLAALPAMLLLIYIILISGKLAQVTSLLGGLLGVVYPVGDVIVVSFALVILSVIRGSRLFRPVGIICLSFVIQVIADIGFISTVSAGTYYVGNWVEMLYIIRFMVLGAGIYYAKDIINLQMGKSRAGK